MTPCSAMNALRHVSASRSYAARAAAWRSTTTASADAGHEQVVVTDAVGVDLAVAAEHDDGHAIGLDLVHEPLREVLRQRGEGDHPIARDGRHAAVEGVLVALVGEGADEPDLAAHVVALDEQRRADDEDVDPEPAGELGGLAVDPAVDVDLAAERLVAEQVAGREQLVAWRRPS